MDYSKNYSLENLVYWCEINNRFEEEVFKTVPNCDGFYEVSSLGRVKSLRCNKELILKQVNDGRGYNQVRLTLNESFKTYKVHVLSAIVFHNHKPCGKVLVVNHKNFIRTDNKANNLEIVTMRENGNRKHLPSSSEFVGVHWSKVNNKWRSGIVLNGKQKYLGVFENEIDAHKAYQKELLAIKLNNIYSYYWIDKR